MRASRLILLAAALMVAAGCTSPAPKDKDEPDYDAVPDADLFSRIADQSGVEKADISFNGTFPERTYTGEITVAADADAQAVLDQAYATLRQGRSDADIGIAAIQGDTYIRFERLPGSGVGTPTELEKRYGPQPGDGKPPAG